MKKIQDISWQVTEPEYRADEAISYSALSAYAREGPSIIPHLKDAKEAEALRFGSLVDCLITEPETLKDRFFIADFPNLPETILRIVKKAFNIYGEDCRSLDKIPDKELIFLADEEGYAPSYKEETRLKNIREKGESYYNMMTLADGRMVMSTNDFDVAKSCVDVLHNHPFTKEFFFVNPFDTSVEKVFQLKFKLVDKYLPRMIRCMFDLIIVDHEKKTIRPCDLKTTGYAESHFEESILKWRYDLQATMYSYILWSIIQKDDYFKDFTILPFTFIVINRNTQTPLVWEFNGNLVIVDRQDAYGNIYKSWKRLLEELNWYMINEHYDYPIEAYKNNGIMKFNKLKIIK